VAFRAHSTGARSCRTTITFPIPCQAPIAFALVPDGIATQSINPKIAAIDVGFYFSQCTTVVAHYTSNLMAMGGRTCATTYRCSAERFAGVNPKLLPSTSLNSLAELS